MSWNETEILAARRGIVKAAHDMLAGRLSYLEGARKIIAAGTAARLDEHDADLLPFVGIVSETDALPFGEMRKYWQAGALIALQPERRKGSLGPRIWRTSLPKPRRALFNMKTEAA